MNTTLKLHGTVFILAAFLAGAASVAVAQTAVTKPVGLFTFPFPPGSDLIGQTESSTGTAWQLAGQPGLGVQIVRGSLSVPGLAAASGNRARIVAPSAGTSIAFAEPISSGTVFMSFALRVSDLEGSGQDGVPLLGFDGGHGGIAFVRAAQGGYQLGLAASADASPEWFAPADGSGTFTIDDTVFVVASSTFVGEVRQGSLWVNPGPSAFGAATAPTPNVTATAAGGTPASFTGVMIHPAVSPGSPAAYELDEIRVGKSWASVTPPASALIGYSSGSNGSYGPLEVAADTTIPLPPDGIIHATTINIAGGKTLRFERSANNTPVFLLATRNVKIDGVIEISGQGGTETTRGVAGPGGWDGGMPATGANPPGDGLGPGGGRYLGTRGSAGAHQYLPNPNISSSGNGKIYGGPLGEEGGSGGSGVAEFAVPTGGGGGGGGSIMIAANEEIVVGPQGIIRADGGPPGPGGYNAGSGGRIRLVAPKVGGAGTLSVIGPRGGGGFVRIDRLDRIPLGFQIEASPYGSVVSVGSVMMVRPNPIPQLTIDSVDGTTLDANSGPVTIIRPPDAPPSFDVVVKARDFRSLVPTQLYVVPDNDARTVLTASMDNRNPGTTSEHTFSVTLPPNIRSTLQVFAGKSLPADP